MELTGVSSVGGRVDDGLADCDAVSDGMNDLESAATYVFADDLLQGHRQDLPGEDLDILLDVTRFGIGESHDDLEELLAIGLSLGHGEWSEPLQVATNAVLLLDCEASGYKLLKEVDGVDTGDKALVLLLPPDATDAHTVVWSLVDCHGSKCRRDCATRLRSLEVYDSSLGIPLFHGPVLGHGVQVSLYFQDSLVWVQCIGVEALTTVATGGDCWARSLLEG